MMTMMIAYVNQERVNATPHPTKTIASLSRPILCSTDWKYKQVPGMMNIVMEPTVPPIIVAHASKFCNFNASKVAKFVISTAKRMPGTNGMRPSSSRGAPDFSEETTAFSEVSSPGPIIDDHASEILPPAMCDNSYKDSR